MSQQNPTPAPENVTLATGFRQQIPTLIIAILTAFATSYLNSQRTQSDLIHRVEIVERQGVVNAQNTSQNSTALQQNAIRLAELGIIQTNTLEQIKDLKTEQAEIKLMLQRK